MSVYKFESRNIGRCLTEYKSTRCDELVAKAEGFFVQSQFAQIPQDLSKVEIDREGTNVKCGCGEIMYAVIDGKPVEIFSIIDSSD